MAPVKEIEKKGLGMTWTGLDSVGNGYRLCILGNLNGWLGDRTRTGITIAFGVSGENDNGRRVVGVLCRKGTLCG